MIPVPHSLATDEGTPLPDGWAMRSWCCCGHQFTARAATVKRAKKMIRRRLRDHRGHVRAAGPGWQM
jgi:hypothetical protein